MKWTVALIWTLCVVHTVKALTTRRVPQIDFYEQAKIENFSNEELELLKPIIDNLNIQYDHISTAKTEDIDILTENKIKDLSLKILTYASADDDYLNIPFIYDESLPDLNNFKGFSKEGSSVEEIRDMEKILQESIVDAQSTVHDIVLQSNELEAKLISVNKIKILKFIVNMLGNVFSLGVRVSRTAYCTYSNIPLINSTLTDGRTNIEFCYTQTRNSINQLRTDIQSSIDTIRQNVLEIIEIYKKIASRESLLGKLLTLIMNVSKLQNDLKESRERAYQTLNQVQNEVPATIATSQECAAFAIPNFIHQLNETVTALTTCYNFVDDSTWAPEPEPEGGEESWETVD